MPSQFEQGDQTTKSTNSPITVSSSPVRETTPASGPVDQLIGKIIANRYQIIGKIGIGGMGAVYEAKHVLLDSRCAVKVMLARSITGLVNRKRFEREAKAAAMLNNAHLVPVSDYGFTDKGLPFIVMPYIEGKTLAAVLKETGRLPVERFERIFGQITEALAHAHGRGVLHRDIKPSNILIATDDQGQDWAYLADLGVAKVKYNRKTLSRITASGEVFGTPFYMSPEQCNGDRLDQRSDIYSLGCVMYEALTGVIPFEANNPIASVLKHLSDEAPSFAQVAPKLAIARPWEEMVCKALRRNPDERFQTAGELLLTIQGVPPEQIQQAVSGVPRKNERTWPLVGGCTALAAAATFTITTWWHSSHQGTAPQTATTVSSELSPKSPFAGMEKQIEAPVLTGALLDSTIQDAVALDAQGRYLHATPLWSAVINSLRSSTDTGLWNTALSGYAQHLAAMHEQDAADDIFQQLHDGLSRAYGENSYAVQANRYVRATNLMQGNCLRARQLLVDLVNSPLGENGKLLQCNAWNLLARIDDKLGRWQDMDTDTEHVLQMRSEARDPGEYAYALKARSDALRNLHKCEQALPLAKRALELSRKIFGDKADSTRAMQDNYDVLLKLQSTKTK